MSEEPRKPHLSPSQLDTYAMCPERYRRRYIEKEIIPPGIAMLRGTGVHGGIEANMRQKIESRVDLPRSQIVDAAVAKFEAELAGGYALNADEASTGAGKVISETKDVVADLADLAATDLCPKYQPTLVEQPVRIALPHSTHDLLGVIDLADETGVVVDVKTSGKIKSQDDADSSVQLTVYSAMHKVAVGEFPVELRLETLVSNKKPKLQTLATQRGPADVEALANRLDAVTDAITKGVFTPAPPGAWQCSKKWCGYFSSCRFVNGGRGSQGD